MTTSKAEWLDLGTVDELKQKLASSPLTEVVQDGVRLAVSYRDGTFGAPWGRDTMDPGQYWWFVYAISQGEVVATSVAQGFVPPAQRALLQVETHADALLDRLAALSGRPGGDDYDRI